MATSAARALLATIVFLGLAGGARASSLAPVDPPKAAPDFRLADVTGKEHRLRDYRGKLVVVNFWATWCAPCRRELPSMQRLWQARGGKDLVILAVAVGEDPAVVREFADGFDPRPGFPLLPDPASRLLDAWPVIGLPTSFVIDPRGRIVASVLGDVNWESPEVAAQLDGWK